MREVDTQALGRVAPVLGVGNPHTAVGQVVFDDDNLQQSLPVDRLLPGTGLLGGWVWMSNTLTFLGADTAHLFVTQAQILSVLEPDTPAEQLRIWVMRVGGSVDADVLVSQLVSVSVSGFPGNANGGLRLPFFFGDETSISQDGTGNLLVLPAAGAPAQGPFPFPLLGDARIEHAGQASGAGDISAHILCWVGPIGLNPPGLA